jgi:hypothetical protein
VFPPRPARGANLGQHLVHAMADAGPAVFWLVAGGALASGAWLLAWTRRGGR